MLESAIFGSVILGVISVRALKQSDTLGSAMLGAVMLGAVMVMGSAMIRLLGSIMLGATVVRFGYGGSGRRHSFSCIFNL